MRLTIFLSLILLAGCDSFPAIMPQERCATILDTQNPVSDGQNEYYTGVCQCQLYEWTHDYIGKIGTPTTKPLLYCDKNIGYGPQSTATIYAWQESIRLWLLRHER